MKKSVISGIIALISIVAGAQKMNVGVFAGAAAYNGDLVSGIFPKKVTNGGIGLNLGYEVSDKFSIRLGAMYAIVGGADRFSNDSGRLIRNLAFETKIIEGSLVGEYHLFSLYERKLTPYIFSGLAVFHFNPYAYYNGKQQVYLQPLSTEGQGLSGYPDKKPYKLTQAAIPFGGGIKYVITDKIRVGIEGSIRYLFTDYLDDVSTTYANEADLLAAKGQLAVDMSYRGDETFGSQFYPSKGDKRGSPDIKDFYYFAGISLSVGLGGNNSNGDYGKRLRGRSRTGCPSVY